MTPITSATILFLLCWFYGIGLQAVFWKWPDARRFLFFFVILGVALVGICAVPALGLEDVAILAGYFTVGGLPMCLTSIVANTLEDSRRGKERQVREILIHGLEED